MSEPEPKPIRVSFDAVPLTISMQPRRMRCIGTKGNMLEIQLRNGTILKLGPYETAKAAEDAMMAFTNALDRSHDHRPTPTTREEYLELLSLNAWTFPYVGSEMPMPPTDWIEAAWDLPEVQDSIVDGGICRNYSKGLGLCCSAGFLAMLDRSLRGDQVAQLYHDIRNRQPTREMEFREAFLTAFASHADVIPPALTEAEYEQAQRQGDYWRQRWQQRRSQQDVIDDVKESGFDEIPF